MMNIMYIGNLGGAAYRAYEFPRNVWVSVPESVAMHFGDSADFEIGDPITVEDSTPHANTGEEE